MTQEMASVLIAAIVTFGVMATTAIICFSVYRYDRDINHRR